MLLNNDEVPGAPENSYNNNFLYLMQDNYKDFKVKHREWYIVMVSVAIVLWFRGITGLLDIFLIHNNSIIGNIITILIAVIVFILDDFSLSEIFSPKDEVNDKQYVRNSAASVSISPFN